MLSIERAEKRLVPRPAFSMVPAAISASLTAFFPEGRCEMALKSDVAKSRGASQGLKEGSSCR